MAQLGAVGWARALRVVLGLLMVVLSAAALWVGWRVRPLMAALGWDRAPVIWMMGSYIAQAVAWLLGAAAFLRPRRRGGRLGCFCLGPLVLMNVTTVLLAHLVPAFAARMLPGVEGRATARLMVLYALGAELVAVASIVLLAKRTREWSEP